MGLAWNEEEYAIGIGALDAQHKELITLAGELAALRDRKGGVEEAKGLLGRLHSYTHYHFTSEEAVLMRFEFPGARDHVALHRSFAESVRRQLDQFTSDRGGDLDAAVTLVEDWVSEHVKGADREYAEFLRKKGIRVSDSFFGVGAEDADVEAEALSLWERRKLALRIKEIDAQHRELVFILQQVNDLNKRGVSSERRRLYLPVIIKKLYWYSRYHFDLEESLLEKRAYPDLDAHKALHRGFVLKVGTFAKEYKAGRSDLTDEIVAYLRDWTMQHILRDDGAYRDYLAPEGTAG
jgi:hemerythrin-like metal-binding protein